MSPIIVIRNFLSLVVIVWSGSQLGPWLFFAGLIRTGVVPFWSSVIYYIYLPTSGLLLASCLLGMLLTSESKNGQLTLKGSEFWLKILNIWSYQNQAVAAACLIICFYSIVHLAFIVTKAFYDL